MRFFARAPTPKLAYFGAEGPVRQKWTSQNSTKSETLGRRGDRIPEGRRPPKSPTAGSSAIRNF